MSSDMATVTPVNTEIDRAREVAKWPVPLVPVWLWITNVAILLGAEFNAPAQRERAVVAGQRHHGA